MWRGNWNFMSAAIFAKYDLCAVISVMNPRNFIYREKRSDASLGLDYH